MAAEAVLQTLGHAWECLDAFPVPKAVFGGLALSAWDHARSTKDVDILFDPAGHSLHAILAKLGEAGFRGQGKHPVIRVDDAEFIKVFYEPPDAFMQIQVDLLSWRYCWQIATRWISSTCEAGCTRTASSESFVSLGPKHFPANSRLSKNS